LTRDGVEIPEDLPRLLTERFARRFTSRRIDPALTGDEQQMADAHGR
jgi:hypothetical protein